MLYLTCTTITSVDHAHFGVSGAKDWVSVDCGTNTNCNDFLSSVDRFCVVLSIPALKVAYFIL